MKSILTLTAPAVFTANNGLAVKLLVPHLQYGHEVADTSLIFRTYSTSNDLESPRISVGTYGHSAAPSGKYDTGNTTIPEAIVMATHLLQLLVRISVRLFHVSMLSLDVTTLQHFQEKEISHHLIKSRAVIQVPFPFQEYTATKTPLGSL